MSGFNDKVAENGVRVATGYRMISNMHVAQTVLKTRHSNISPGSLSKTWCVGLETARLTQLQTTQQRIQTATRPLSRRYQTDLMSTRIKCILASVSTDNICFVNVKSTR